MSSDNSSQSDRMDWSTSTHSSPGDSVVINEHANGTTPSTMDGSAPLLTEILEQTSISDLYHRIASSSDAETLSDILNPGHFKPGSECILQYASAQNNQNVLRRVLTYMDGVHLDVNLRDATDSSALDAAIRAGVRENIDVLIAARANTNGVNRFGRTPLHTAILHSADSDIWDLLLRQGANPNNHIFVDSEFMTPLVFATEYDPYAASPATDHQYFANIRILLNAGANYEPKSPDCIKAYENFLKRVLDVLRRGLSSHTGQPQYLEECMRLFLEKGSNPGYRLNDLESDRDCDGNCETFSDFVFFHAAHTNLPDILIKWSDLDQFGKPLVEGVLHPCRAWRRHAPPRTPVVFLEKLLARRIKFGATSNPLCTALMKSPEELKSDFVYILLSTNSARVHAFDAVYGRPLAALNQVRGSLRWRLAEMVLESDILSGPSPDGSEGHRLKVFIHDIHSSYLEYTSDQYRTTLASYLNYFSHDTSAESARTVDQCLRNVIHVLTTHILAESPPSSPVLRATSQQRQLHASEMRRHYSLPEIPIPNHMETENGDAKRHDL